MPTHIQLLSTKRQTWHRRQKTKETHLLIIQKDLGAYFRGYTCVKKKRFQQCADFGSKQNETNKKKTSFRHFGTADCYKNSLPIELSMEWKFA